MQNLEYICNSKYYQKDVLFIILTEYYLHVPIMDYNYTRYIQRTIDSRNLVIQSSSVKWINFAK